MTLVEKAKRYAKQHSQTVTLAWIDGSRREYPAGKAVRLCEARRVAACIMGAEAPDEALADMLNKMLDDE